MNASSSASSSAQIVNFLKNHVIGKAVAAAPVTSRVDKGHVEAAYEEDAVFSNLTERANGFSFDMTTLARGTRYLPAKNGFAAEGTLNAVRVVRYDITERSSSRRLVGYARFVASTNAQPDPFGGVVFLVRMSLDGERLSVHETMVGYADVPSAQGSPRPVAWDGKYVYGLEKGRLTISYDQQTFDVDPETLERRPTGEKFPTQVSREVQFPAELVGN